MYSHCNCWWVQNITLYKSIAISLFLFILHLYPFYLLEMQRHREKVSICWFISSNIRDNEGRAGPMSRAAVESGSLTWLARTKLPVCHHYLLRCLSAGSWNQALQLRAVSSTPSGVFCSGLNACPTLAYVISLQLVHLSGVFSSGNSGHLWPSGFYSLAYHRLQPQPLLLQENWTPLTADNSQLQPTWGLFQPWNACK